MITVYLYDVSSDNAFTLGLKDETEFQAFKTAWDGGKDFEIHYPTANPNLTHTRNFHLGNFGFYDVTK